MRDLATLLIDESGKASLAEKADEPFSIAGVVVMNNEVGTVEGFFRYIKGKYGLPLDKSFHSYDIYENPQTRLRDEELLDLSTSLAEFISFIPVEITICYTNKVNFKAALGVTSNEDFKGDSKRKEMKDYPYRVLASKLFTLFATQLDNDDCLGQVLADSRQGGDHQLLKTLHLWKGKNIKADKEYLKVRIVAINFAEKGFVSGGLEITDLISYISFFKIRRRLSAVNDLGIPKIWKVIRDKCKLIEIKEEDVRKFFAIKKGGVHKYLKR